MRIGIDARFWGEAGPGRYIQNLIRELEKIDRENEYFIFLRQQNFLAYTPKNKRFKKVLAPYRWYSLTEQLFFPFKIYQTRVNLMHFPQFNIPIFWPGKFVVTIHDMIMHEFSTQRGTTRSRPIYCFKKFFYLLTFWWACKRALHILTPSEATKDDLIKKLKIEPAKISVTYEGVDEMFKTKNQKPETRKDVLEKYGIRKPYLLYVGSMYPHKNLERLLKAFGILTNNYHFEGQLVLVGKESYFSRQLRNFVKQKRLEEKVVFPGAQAETGYIADEEVKALYSQALLFVFPSLKEGFGIPPLEAMSMGLPVVASNLSSTPEVCGKAAFYFNPHEAKDIARKVATLIHDEAEREELIKLGFERVKKFSWEKMAQQTLGIYERISKSTTPSQLNTRASNGISPRLSRRIEMTRGSGEHSTMKVALVHDDLIQHGGAERLFEAMLEIWPQASVFTSMAVELWINKLSGSSALKTGKLKVSFMQKLPFKKRLFRHYFPLYPLAFESFDFSGFDIVLSSSARFAHGVVTRPETLHLAYINSPGRMFWEAASYYYRPGLLKTMLTPFLSYLRLWDRIAAQRPDFIIANSKTPQARVKKYWGRNSAVIYPFVDLERFTLMGAALHSSDSHPTGGGISADEYYLIVSRLVAWKRIDLAIKACNNLRLNLLVIGEGPDKKHLKRLAGPTIEFKGRVSDQDMVGYYRNCQALVVTQKEDFGIAPLEAMACGRPVVALRLGGTLETVVEGKTGEFFYPQTVEALEHILRLFNPKRYHPENCCRQAERFGKRRFKQELKDFVEEKWLDHKARRAS